MIKAIDLAFTFPVELGAESGVESVAFGEGDKTEGFWAKIKGDGLLIVDGEGFVAIGDSFNRAVMAEVLDFYFAVGGDDEGSAC